MAAPSSDPWELGVTTDATPAFASTACSRRFLGCAIRAGFAGLQIPSVPVSHLKGGVLLVELQGAELTMGVTRRPSRSRGHTAVLGWAGLAGICSPEFPRSWELPSHSPEPAVLGTRGQGKGTKRHPGSCRALGRVLCSSTRPHGQTSPVSIQDFIFPECRERQMSA